MTGRRPRFPYKTNYIECANERDALRAENERLLVDNAELSAECDQWQKKVADCWREIDRLRAQVQRLT